MTRLSKLTTPALVAATYSGAGLNCHGMQAHFKPQGLAAYSFDSAGLPAEQAAHLKVVALETVRALRQP